MKAQRGAIMQIEYIQSGDYQIPNLIGNREPEGTLTKYGLMRRNFLKEHRSGIYSGLLLKGTLKEHCLTIQEQAEQRMDLLTEQMAKDQGVDEQMKRNDQMRWVGLMNNIRNSAEEIVLSELIYS
ncbi:MAG: TnpV protein [Firmicutes bacterium]|nr:TnpV protein [Bacillota bacterium]